MTPAEIERICLSLPGAELRFPFGPDTRTWCVHRKMFAWCTPSRTPLSVQVKADPDIVEHLKQSYRWIKPGYHMNKRHWISIRLDLQPESTVVIGLLEDAHQIVVQGLPQKLRPGLLAD